MGKAFMRKITVGKLFELYLDTLENCGENTKKLSDEMIEYNIFEEFIVGVTTFLANNNLDILLEYGLIDEQIYSDSERLRAYTLSIDNSDQWNVLSFRNTQSWDEIMKLSDDIKNQIKIKWDENDIEEIYKL